MGNETKIGQLDSRVMLQNLATTLNELVVREHQILQEELRQLSTLIRDAIVTLEESFQLINEQASEQSKLAISVTEVLHKNKQHLPLEINNISKISEQINKNVATAVRSLQFEDIIQQLAAHSNNRAGQIEQLFVKLGEKLTTLKSIQSEDANSIKQVINEMRTDVEDFRQAVEKDNPVKQVTMEEGKIELF